MFVQSPVKLDREIRGGPVTVHTPGGHRGVRLTPQNGQPALQHRLLSHLDNGSIRSPEIGDHDEIVGFHQIGRG